MNIKSNKENKSMWNLDVGKFFGSLVMNKLYWTSILVWGLITALIVTLDGSWGIHLTLTIIVVIAHIVIVGIAESNRISNERWNDRKANYNIFSMIGMPLIIIGLSYGTIITPMYDDYKHSDRIDRVLPMAEVKLFYNDQNSIFILFVEGQNQPLLIDNGGHSDTYNRLKADYLDKKIKVIKKETKGWTDTNSSIQYHLDNYTFD